MIEEKVIEEEMIEEEMIRENNEEKIKEEEIEEEGIKKEEIKEAIAVPAAKRRKNAAHDASRGWAKRNSVPAPAGRKNQLPAPGGGAGPSRQFREVCPIRRALCEKWDSTIPTSLRTPQPGETMIP